MASFKCSDIGLECGFAIETASKDELLKHVVNHAKWAHNMDPIPNETLETVKKAVKA
jgi:predicted small metal-binding protein